MELKGQGTVSAKLVCKTNLHIGGGQEGLEIGGQDNPVIRHPITRLPYIPGSSLKGKFRSLLELADPATQVHQDVQPCGCGRCDVCWLFGKNVAKNREVQPQPTRLIVRDAHLCEEDAQKWGPDSFVKFEVPIDRKTGTVSRRGGLRNVEFVPAGAKFDLLMHVRFLGNDDRAKARKVLEKAFALLEKDYLGGNGTRGYGQVCFKDLRFEGFDE